MNDNERVLMAGSTRVYNIVKEILESSSKYSVFGLRTCDDSKILKKVENLTPRMVIIDLEMCEGQGLDAVRKIMDRNPVPVLVMTAGEGEDSALVVKAFQYGAVGFLSKPAKSAEEVPSEFRKKLISELDSAGEVDVKTSRGAPQKKSRPKEVSFTKPEGEGVLIIGGSTGAPGILSEIISKLPADFSIPGLVAQHMPAEFIDKFAQRLDAQSSLTVKVAEDGEPIESGCIYFAPGNYHMRIEGGKHIRVQLDSGAPVNYVRPSADVLMKSAVPVYGDRIIGVLLSGMGKDGAEGLKAIKEAGGKTIVQNEETSVVFGMPKEAIELDAVDLVRPSYDINEEIIRALSDW